MFFVFLKRSSARSWKPVFAVLRGHVLYLHKDKGSAHQVSIDKETSECQMNHCMLSTQWVTPQLVFFLFDTLCPV